MADLSTHYKEITPEQTVENIKQFFADNKFDVRLTDVSQTEAGTWYCRVELYKDGVHINGTNGKGAQKNYALASGYAELYERFCNKQFFLYNYYWSRDYMKKNHEKFGYYFSKNEKMLSYDEEFNNCRRIHDYIKYYSCGIPELEKLMMNYITDDIYVGIPMHNIADDKDVMYVDPRWLMLSTRSNGMAAGNTRNEALAQALSEIVEREAESQLLKNFNTPHYAINLDKIENPLLQQFISAIKAEGYTLYLFDLSYNSQMPVIMSLLLDKQTGHLNINFGAFPVFEIAAERVITELYQGIKTYHSSYYKSSIRFPFKAIPYDEMLQIYGNSIDGSVFSADFFNTIRFMDSYNKEVFIDKNSSNQDMLQYYINLQEKIPGIKFYYIDNSLCDDVCAVHVILENTDDYTPMTICNSTPIFWNEISVLQTIKQVNLMKKFYDKMRAQEKINPILLIEIINNYRQGLFNGHLIDALIFTNSFSVEPRSSGLPMLMPLINVMMDQDGYAPLPPDIVDTVMFKEYKKYYLLMQYIKTGVYNTEELLNIFNNIFDFGITVQDMNNCLSPGYLLTQAYINPLQKYLTSQSYNDIIDVFVNNNHS